VAAGGAAINTQGFNVTWAGPIAGTIPSATLTKLGTGSLTLNSTTYTSSYVGAFNINAGTVTFGGTGGDVMGNLASVNLANSAGVALNIGITSNTSETIGSLSGGGSNGGNVALGAI